MSCPYLWGKYLRSCSASREVYVPTVLEFHEYCSPDRYDRFCLCPVYRGSGRSLADSEKEPLDGRQSRKPASRSVP